MKTIIFDLDGTVLNTLVDLKNAVNHGLKTRNLPEIDLETVRRAIGNGTQVLIRKCCPDYLSDKERTLVFTSFKNYYLDHYDDYTKPFEGVKDMLENLKGKVRLALVSNKDDDLTQRLIKKEFDGLFDIVQGSYFDQPKKPNPYLINKIIKENNLDKKDCLYIGDTNIDKESADNAGLKYFLVNYGFRTKEELEKMCPNDTSISSVEELHRTLLLWVNS